MQKLRDTGERLIPEGHMQTLTYGEHISRYKAVLELCRGKSVADIASGTGYGSKMIAQVASSVIGIDYSKEATEYAIENYSAKNLKYRALDATATDIKKSSIDVVISFETIEHLSDPKGFIKEVKRILTEDGVFIVSTPNDKEFMEGNNFHTHEFDFKELDSLISSNFRKKEFYFQGTWFATGIYRRSDFVRAGNSEVISYKTFEQDANSAIYFIVLASNSSKNLVKLQPNNVIADVWSTKLSLERGNHTANLLKANKDKISKYKKDLKSANKRISSMNRKYSENTNSIETRIGCLILGPIRYIKGIFNR